MGTETSFHDPRYKNACVFVVKLNNPLMGTETDFTAWGNNMNGNELVKLNNPLMGTETGDSDEVDAYVDHQSLN